MKRVDRIAYTEEYGGKWLFLYANNTSEGYYEYPSFEEFSKIPIEVPDGYNMPTLADYETLYSNCKAAWQTYQLLKRPNAEEALTAHVKDWMDSQ